jgi:hypothetical protein
MKHILLPILLLLGLIVGCQSLSVTRLTSWLDQSRTAAYGEKVFYFQDQPIVFPDFTLIYQGERQVTSDKYPRGFTYHDFQVDNGDESQMVSWSSGTGEIGPSFFTVAGQQYMLELISSDELGRLTEGELVIGRE